MKVKSLLQEVNTSTFIEDLLTAYGVENVDSYLNPTSDLFESPWEYPNMEDGVVLLHKAIKEEWKIGVLTDSDADGFMSAAIITHFLHILNTSSTPIFHKGKTHGLSNEVFDEIVELEFDLLIIPDAGTNDKDRCGILLEVCDTQTLVLDHHVVTTENPYAVVINPHLSPHLNHNISGAGVVDKFIRAYSERYEVDSIGYSDMVATSIVADICDLTALENRQYISQGLECNPIQNPLLDIMFKEFADSKYTPKDVGWCVSPKINALCRVGTQEQKEIFFKGLAGLGDLESALDVAKKAHSLQSREVKKLADKIEEDLVVYNSVVIAYINDLDKNYGGLIANRFLSKYNRPVLMLRERGENRFTGSLRSPYDVMSAINESGLAGCQGHQRACGIWFDKKNLDKLAKWFDKQVEPELLVTAELKSSQITKSLAQLCESHSHLWGTGVEAPTFYIAGIITNTKINVYRKKTNTIKLNIDGVDFIKFRCTEEEADTFESLKKAEIQMIVTLSLNEFRGRVTVQGMVEEYKLIPIKGNIPRITSEDWLDLF